MENIFQFVQFKSFVHSNFWHKLSEIKLNIDKLNDPRRLIAGFYTNNNARNCLLELDCTAFNTIFCGPKETFPCRGVIINKNTIEEFKDCDKKALLIQESLNFWNDVCSGKWIEDPSLLSFFILLSYADLKLHNYYYWFAFPVPSEPILNKIKDPTSISEHFSNFQKENLYDQYINVKDSRQQSFFIIERVDDNILFKKISEKITTNTVINFVDDDQNNLYFGFSDPSEFQSPGWVLRMYIILLIKFCPHLRSKTIKILSLRVSNSKNIDNSIVYEIPLPDSDVEAENIKWTGWEKNLQGNYGPRISAMGKTMNPKILAENSINLNLKLMKWRLLPELDLDIISSTKCLLLGAGTLGCAVSRNLMAWGVTKITFVDCGKVSFSNPTRQNLYIHEDAINGGKKKATTAALRIMQIHPGMNCQGYDIKIPMPGHSIGESLMAKTIEELELLEKLIIEHDVLFLLTDSRESRWLPTFFGAYHNKIVMNAALGFDSYLVMRHGSRRDFIGDTLEVIEDNVIPGLKCINGRDLGCYFCNDITAPGNSLKDRTLDQQCTVTRPAVSNIASSLVVELLIAILQHKAREFAPAYIQLSNNSISAIPEGILGILPHTIRGTLSTFEQIQPATEKFSQCIACSEKVLNEYKKQDKKFLLQVLDSAKFLEDLTGISELLQDDAIVQFDSDFEISSNSESE